MASSSTSTVLSTSFSQTEFSNALVVGTQDSIRVYHLDGEGVRQHFSCPIKSAVKVGVYFTTNVFAYSKFQNKFVVEKFENNVLTRCWNHDCQEAIINLQWSFGYFIVTLPTSVLVFENEQVIRHFMTASNANGSLVAVSTAIGSQKLAWVSPDRTANAGSSHSPQKSTINSSSVVKIYDFEKKTSFEVSHTHDSPVDCIALSHDGKLLATASSLGTLVRVFNAESGGRPVFTFRRGYTICPIDCLAFNDTSSPGFENQPSILCAVSDRGTVHIFRLSEDENDAVDQLSEHDSFDMTASHDNYVPSHYRGSSVDRTERDVPVTRPTQASTVISSVASVGWKAFGAVKAGVEGLAKKAGMSVDAPRHWAVARVPGSDQTDGPLKAANNKLPFRVATLTDPAHICVVTPDGELYIYSLDFRKPTSDGKGNVRKLTNDDRVTLRKIWDCGTNTLKYNNVN